MSKEALMAVLQRAAEEVTFYCQLYRAFYEGASEDYAQILRTYDLTREERVALASGDVRWIESYLGRKLDEGIMAKVMIPLLSRE